MISRVQILLAIHNGDDYLDELLFSLSNQTNCLIHLIVSFDNTEDDSESILQRYLKNFESVTVYRNHFGNHNQNFDFLFSNRLPNIPLAFCDQDDLWHPNKIQESLRYLERLKGPALFTSSVKIMNSNNVIPKNVEQNQISSIFSNPSKGCTQVLNVELQDLVDQLGGLSETQFYDWWVYVVAKVFGQVYFSHIPFIEYRVHKNNTIGQPNLQRQILNHLYRIMKTGSVISPESIRYILLVRDISTQRRIKLSVEVEELLLLMCSKRVHRFSILEKNYICHPQKIKNYIIKLGLILLPMIDHKH